jgi:hypothetical protein
MCPPMDRMVELIGSRALFALLVLLLIAFVRITALWGRPKRRATRTEFPPPIGAKVIVWVSLAFWMLLVFASLDLGMYWLAALFVLGPLYMLWRWPETISIDELRIFQSAWCHQEVSMLWEEIASIETSKSRDVLLLRSRNGQKVKISTSQVAAEELIREIKRHTGYDIKVQGPF